MAAWAFLPVPSMVCVTMLQGHLGIIRCGTAAVQATSYKPHIGVREPFWVPISRCMRPSGVGIRVWDTLIMAVVEAFRVAGTVLDQPTCSRVHAQNDLYHSKPSGKKSGNSALLSLNNYRWRTT